MMTNMTVTEAYMTYMTVTVTNVTLMLRSLSILSSRYYRLLTARLTIVTDVADSFNETLRTVHDEGTLQTILKGRIILPMP